MFIKEVKRPNGSVSIRIVKSVRQGNGVTSKLVRVIGQAKEEFAINLLRELAEKTIVYLKNKEKPVLPCFSSEEFYGVKRKRKPVEDHVKLKEVREVKRINDGITDIFGKKYEQLGFHKTISGTRKDEQWNNILQSCVIARIAKPESKRKTVQELELDYAIDIPLEKVYRMMDHVAKREEQLKRQVRAETLKLFKEKVNVLFFDVTTLYFESTKYDDLRNFGFSKDCKFKEVQVMLALITTTEGMPITYKTFPGNTYEGHTLLNVIEDLQVDFQVENVMLVADRAMFNEDNLKEMEEKKIKYIVAAKLKSFSGTLKEQILTDDFTAKLVSNELQWIREYEYKKRRLVVSYSTKRAYKDKVDRTRLVERIINKAKDDKIPASKLITNAGSKKYIKIIKSDIRVNQERISEDAKWDGLHGVLTNLSEIKAEEILSRYRGLWQIEESFRINKHTLKMRPIFHWKSKRIKAHIAICFLAFTIIRHTQYFLKQKNVDFSIEEIKTALLRTESSIVQDITTKRLYVIPSKITEQQKVIYKTFDMIRDEKPYAL